jgi:hypothetical protein
MEVGPNQERTPNRRQNGLLENLMIFEEHMYLNRIS